MQVNLLARDRMDKYMSIQYQGGKEFQRIAEKLYSNP